MILVSCNISRILFSTTMMKTEKLHTILITIGEKYFYLIILVFDYAMVIKIYFCLIGIIFADVNFNFKSNNRTYGV
jgi:hypothetical protein